MKTRSGFVSNSSSSSFIISLKDMTAYQLDQIKNHISEGKILGMDWVDESNAWSIEVMDGVVLCRTMMDNFDLREFVTKIGINPEKIKII